MDIAAGSVARRDIPDDELAGERDGKLALCDRPAPLGEQGVGMAIGIGAFGETPSARRPLGSCCHSVAAKTGAGGIVGVVGKLRSAVIGVATADVTRAGLTMADTMGDWREPTESTGEAVMEGIGEGGTTPTRGESSMPKWPPSSLALDRLSDGPTNSTS